MHIKGSYLGEFEEVVMLTVGILYENAYGIAIKKEIEKRMGRGVSIGALHSALYRLEKKGYLESLLGETTNERGGKRKRYFKVTDDGQKILSEMMQNRKSLWQAIPDAAFKIRYS